MQIFLWIFNSELNFQYGDNLKLKFLNMFLIIAMLKNFVQQMQLTQHFRSIWHGFSAVGRD